MSFLDCDVESNKLTKMDYVNKINVFKKNSLSERSATVALVFLLICCFFSLSDSLLSDFELELLFESLEVASPSSIKSFKEPSVSAESSNHSFKKKSCINMVYYHTILINIRKRK